MDNFCFRDYRIVRAKGFALLNEAMSHVVQGHPRQRGHSEEF